MIYCFNRLKIDAFRCLAYYIDLVSVEEAFPHLLVLGQLAETENRLLMLIGKMAIGDFGVAIIVDPDIG
jgi:hypothetical protein